MLILEGPDCAGKSMLAEKLMENCQHPKKKLTHYSEHNFDKMLDHVVESSPGIVDVSDRFHVSHIPYDKYYRNKDSEIYTIRMLDRALLARNSVMVICLPPWEVVLEKWLGRRETELIQNVKVLQKIYNWYADYEPEIPYLHYDYTTTSWEEFNRQLLQTMTFYINRTEPESGAGSTEIGKVMLVAEKCNNSRQHTIPFASTTGSGPWLANQLEAADIAEQDLFWINVHKTNGSDNSTRLIRAIDQQQPAYVIALGGIAATMLESYDIDFETFSHPQYWKRFKHKYQYPLIPHLEEILYGD